VPNSAARTARFVGIDLAGSPERTGVVVLTLRGSRAEATSPAAGFVADDADLVALVDSTTTVGLDAPLGWPDDFVAAVAAHSAQSRWPTFEEPHARASRESLRYRQTDLFVKGLGIGSTPLSVSSDLIAVVAMRAAWLQSAWITRWGDLEPRDGSGRLVETYPAAALRAWGFLPPRGVRYKGGRSAAHREDERLERERMVAELEDRAESWLDLSPELRFDAVRSDHAFDALLSALVALASASQLTYPVPDELSEIALREGWIHVPSTVFEALGVALRPGRRRRGVARTAR